MSAELVPLPHQPPPPAAPPPANDLVGLWLSGRSPSTVRAYAADLNRFANWWGRPSPAAAAADLLLLRAGDANALALRYRNDLLADGLAAATVARRLASLRSVVDLANAVGRVAWTLRVPGPRPEPRRDVRGPDRAERKRLWRALEALGDSPRDRRDRAAFALCFDLGLRRAEVVGIDLADVEWPPGAPLPTAVLVRGKGHREKQRLPLGPGTARELAPLVETRRAGPAPDGGRDARPLFVRTDRPGDGRLTGDGLQRLVSRAGRAAGLDRKLRPHGLRHAAITAALDAGHDVRKVRLFSRHAKIETVIRYDDARDDSASAIAGHIARERKAARR